MRPDLKKGQMVAKEIPGKLVIILKSKSFSLMENTTRATSSTIAETDKEFITMQTETTTMVSGKVIKGLAEAVSSRKMVLS